jgi:ribonuclease VapC
MIIDSSVLVAILLGEPEADLFSELISKDRYRFMSTVSFVETSIVISSRFGSQGFETLDALILESGLTLLPFSKEQAYLARQAYLNYGKGRHPAKLNFGDCCSCALAKVVKQPLLFKGNDFIHTDIPSVMDGL